LTDFRSAFERYFSGSFSWSGGQVASNVACLPACLQVRRGERVKPGENFELGDLRCEIAGHSLVVEFESEAIAVHNLLKY
jgi:hypothetical protein